MLHCHLHLSNPPSLYPSILENTKNHPPGSSPHRRLKHRNKKYNDSKAIANARHQPTSFMRETRELYKPWAYGCWEVEDVEEPGTEQHNISILGVSFLHPISFPTIYTRSSLIPTIQLPAWRFSVPIFSSDRIHKIHVLEPSIARSFFCFCFWQFFIYSSCLFFLLRV